MSRELDVTIAEALGYSLAESASEPVMDRSKSEFMSQLERVPYYSTDGNAMLELDREMRERGYYLTIMKPHFLNVLTGRVIEFAAIYQTLEQLSQYEHKECQAVVNFKGTETAKNEPLARALSAYKALTGKEWEGEGE